jgi:hypothetical protein
MFPYRSLKASVSRELCLELEKEITELTRRLVGASIFLAGLRTEKARQQGQPGLVGSADVRTAVDLLGLPRHFRKHFSTLPTRMERFGTEIIGIGNYSYRELGMDKKDSTTVQIAEAVLTLRDSGGMTKHLAPWPTEWNIDNGFRWSAKAEEKYESNFETASSPDTEQSLEKMESVAEQDWIVDPENILRHRRRNRISEDDDALLDAETEYLDTIDTQRDQIEGQYLKDYINHGEACARQSKRKAIKSHNLKHPRRSDLQIRKPYDQRKKTKERWDAVRKHFTARYGSAWADYGRDIAGPEGGGWEGSPQEWEVIQKSAHSIKLK